MSAINETSFRGHLPETSTIFQDTEEESIFTRYKATTAALVAFGSLFFAFQMISLWTNSTSSPSGLISSATQSDPFENLGETIGEFWESISNSTASQKLTDLRETLQGQFGNTFERVTNSTRDQIESLTQTFEQFRQNNKNDSVFQLFEAIAYSTGVAYTFTKDVILPTTTDLLLNGPKKAYEMVSNSTSLFSKKRKRRKL